jgi:phosphoglycolate phosphatase
LLRGDAAPAFERWTADSFSPLCETGCVASQLHALIFDLDGTLTDSKPGIVSCLRKVLDARNMGDQGPLDRFVGPPVEEWTAELLPDASEESRAELVREYRACYDLEGWNNNSVFAGVREMLAQLHQLGFPLFICTSKQHRAAVRILDFFELSSMFRAIYGDKAEYANHSKAQLLANLLREHSLDPDSTWMIGDRIFDIQAAHANQIPCLAAAWGYGSAEEFAQADAVAETPAGVIALVLAGKPPSEPGSKTPALRA